MSPSSWELLELRRQRTAIVIIALEDSRVSLDWATNFRNLQVPFGSDVLKIKAGPYGPARNSGLKWTLEGGYNYIFFLDDDVIVPPDILTRLIASNRDLIGALYYRKYPPYAPTAGVHKQLPDGKIGSGPVPNVQFGQIVPVDFLPMGATLISRRCMEAVLSQFPLPFQWGVDISPVPDYGGRELPTLSEDYLYSVRAKALGYQPWLLCVPCRHEFSVVVTERGVEQPT